MWACLKITDCALKHIQFKIKFSSDTDAQIWTEIFDASLEGLEQTIDLPLKQHHHLQVWKHEIKTHNEISDLISSFVQHEEYHVVDVHFTHPMLIKLMKHHFTSWRTSDPLGHHIVEDSLLIPSLYSLTVTFSTLYQPEETFKLDFEDLDNESSRELFEKGNKSLL